MDWLIAQLLALIIPVIVVYIFIGRGIYRFTLANWGKPPSENLGYSVWVAWPLFIVFLNVAPMRELSEHYEEE